MERIRNITAPDESIMNDARRHWDRVAKPLGSLGRFEDMIVQTAGIQRTEQVSLRRCTAVIMCGDHGVTECGVTQCESSVTALCAKEIAGGRSNINAMAASVGADVVAVDVGIACNMDCPGLIGRKIAYGTANMTVGAAMTPEQCRRAVEVGIDTVGALCKNTDIIVSGEMGIGNTTAAAAMSCCMTGGTPEEMTGRGAGLSDEGLERKIRAVKAAIEVNSPDKNDFFDILQKVGGLEIAAMTGLFLGGAVYHIPIVTDGVISLAAAAAAYGIEPLTVKYMIPSHISKEKAARALASLMGLAPVIDAGLHLGEGTGGMMLIPMLRAALAVYENAHTFEEISLEQYKEHSI